jgi:hypothetical protein
MSETHRQTDFSVVAVLTAKTANVSGEITAFVCTRQLRTLKVLTETFYIT